MDRTPRDRLMDLIFGRDASVRPNLNTHDVEARLLSLIDQAGALSYRGKVDPRRREALRLTLGYEDGTPWRTAALAERYGVTADTVRGIISSALQIVRAEWSDGPAMRQRAPGAGRPRLSDEPLERHSITLPASVARTLKHLGGGKLSVGVRIAAERLDRRVG